MNNNFILMKKFAKDIVQEIQAIESENIRNIIYHQLLMRLNNWYCAKDFKNYIENIYDYIYPARGDIVENELKYSVFREDYVDVAAFHEDIFDSYRGVDKRHKLWVSHRYLFYNNLDDFYSVYLSEKASKIFSKFSVVVNDNVDNIVDSMLNYISKNYDEYVKFMSISKNIYDYRYKVHRRYFIKDDDIDWQNKIHGPDGKYKEKFAISELSLTEEEKKQVENIKHTYYEYKSKFDSLEQEIKATENTIGNLIRKFLLEEENSENFIPPTKEEIQQCLEKEKNKIEEAKKKLFSEHFKLEEYIKNYISNNLKKNPDSKFWQFVDISFEYLVNRCRDCIAFCKNLDEIVYEICNPISLKTKKNIEEKKEFLQSKLNISKVFYEHISEDISEDINSCLKVFFEKFPPLQKEIKCVGEIKDLYRYVKDLKDKYPKSKIGEKSYEELSETYNIIRDIFIGSSPVSIDRSNTNSLMKCFQGIYVSSNGISRALKSEKFHPEGCNNAKGFIAHELSHQVDSMLGLSKLEVIKDLYNNSLFFKKLESNLSKSVIPEENMNENVDYYREFVAEALAEYFISEEPREIALNVGFIMEAEYRKKYEI